MAVDYISKWIEAIACKTNDHKVVVNFLKENVFSHFGFFLVQSSEMVENISAIVHLKS